MPKCPYCQVSLPHEVPCQSYQSAAQQSREHRSGTGEKNDGTPTVTERNITVPNPPNALRVVTDSAFIRRPVVPRFVSAGMNGSACCDPTHQMRLNKMSVACQTDDFVLGKRSCNETTTPAASTLVLRSDANSDSGCGAVVEDVLRLQINNVKNMTETIKGPAKIVNGVPWKIMVMPRQHTVAKKGNQKCLGFFLQCCPDSYSDSWSCQASAELRMISQRPSVSDFVRKTTHEYTAKENDWGYSCFMTWADVLDENQGYLKDGGITLAVLVKAEAPKGILSHEAFVKKIEDYIRLADLQSSRGLIDKAIEVNMSAAKFCKDKDLEVRGRLETQRINLIKLKLHQSIERIENVAHKNQNGDCHTLNSLRHALVGNMGCTKNGHHKMLKEKTAAALRNVHHNCALYKDGCNMRHVKKSFTPTLKLRGGDVADCKEYNSHESAIAPEKISQEAIACDNNGNESEAIADEIVPVKELLDDMLTAVTKCDPCPASAVEGLSDEEPDEEEDDVAADEQDRYTSSGSDGYEEVELEVCDRCLVERLEKMSSELPDGSVETTDACCQTEVAESNSTNAGSTEKSTTRQTPLGATGTPEVKRYAPVKLKRNQLLSGPPEKVKPTEQQQPAAPPVQMEKVGEAKQPVLNASDISNAPCDNEADQKRQSLNNRLTAGGMMEIIKEDLRSMSGKIEANLEKMNALGQDAISIGARIKVKGSDSVKKATAILNLRQSQEEDSPLAKAEKAARRPALRIASAEARSKDGNEPEEEQQQKAASEPGRRKKLPPVRKANFQTSEPDLVQELKRCRPALLGDNVMKEAREFFSQEDEMLVNCGKLVCERDNTHVAETVKRVAKQMREMQRQAEYCRNELSEQCKRHYREEHRLNKLNKHLQASLDSANEKLEKANQQLKERRAEMKKLEKRVKAENSSASENALLSRKMESLEYELRELRSKHEEERRKFTEENRRLNEMKLAMQKEVNYANAEIERLQNALDDKSSALTKLEKERTRERTNTQTSLKESSERARRAEMTILELRLEYGLKLLLRAHEDCQSHLSQFDEIAKKHGSIICPADMKALASFQQEWMKVKSTIADMMQKSKAEFQQQIDAVRSGKLLSSLPPLEIPKPPPQPALPRICIGKNAAQRPVVQPIGTTVVSRPSSSVAVGGGKSPGASSTGSSSPSKPEARPLVVSDVTPSVSSSYAAAAVADRTASTMYANSQSIPNTANGPNSRNWSDPLHMQQQLFDGKAFGTMFDSFGGSNDNCPMPSTNNWGWTNSRPSDVCSPIQSLNEYPPTSNCTRTPSRERSECSPCTVRVNAYDGVDKSLPMNVDAVIAKVLTSFPTLSTTDVQQLLEEFRAMQVSKSLKGMSSEAVFTGLANLIIAKRNQPQNVAKGRMEKTNGSGVAKDGCILCKQSFRANNPALTLICGHRFHGGCINKWMTEKRCCPLCTSFNLSQEEYPALA